MKYYFRKKIQQLHGIMWFLGGFAFGCNSIALGAVSLILAIAIDAGISLAVSKNQTPSGPVDGPVWRSGQW